MLKTFIKRMNAGLVAAALSLTSGMGALGVVMTPAVARAESGANWTLNENSKIVFSCLGNGSLYSHTLLTVDQADDGTFTGTGWYDVNNGYTWNASGSVAGDVLNMVVTYTGLASGSVYNLTNGAIAADGSVAGAADGNCQSFTMPSGSLTEVEEPPVQKVKTVKVYGDTAAGENQKGWLFNRDQTTATDYVFNSAGATTGSGSIYVKPIANNNYKGILGNAPAKDKFIAEYFYLGSADTFEGFSYDFKIAGNGTASDANDFYLNVYANLPTSMVTNFYDCRFDYVPTTGSTTSFTTFSVDGASVPVRVQPRNSAVCPADIQSLPEGSTIRAFAINVGDTSATDTGLAGHVDTAVLSTVAKKTTFDFEPVWGKIIKPKADKVVSGWVKLEAKYYDGDKINDDAVQWAVRKGTCAAGTNTVAGNVDGFTTGYEWNGRKFNAVMDARALEEGAYCFVFNPTDDAHQVDVRETRNFFIEAFVPEKFTDCFWGGWKDYLNPEFRNQGQCIKYVLENNEKPVKHRGIKGWSWGWWRG